jgi:hypothetical protein
MSKRQVEVVPGASVGRDAGVFQEQGPRGGWRDNFATIRENRRAPPTTGKGAHWVRIDATPQGIVLSSACTDCDEDRAQGKSYEQ